MKTEDYKKCWILGVGLTLLLSSAIAENPIFSQRYTADPTGLEHDGRLYLWTSHDIDGQTSYQMNDITCMSSDDLVNWTDHGEVFKVPEDAAWATQAWAPTVVFRDGLFYLYTGDANRSIGVASSASPTGPFTDAKGSAVITKDLPNCNTPWCFDPTTFIDDDGQAYCVFGGGNDGGINCRIIKLGADMISTVGEAVSIDAPGFFEGAYLHKRTVNGVSKYYLSYFRNNGTGLIIDYMMSDNPMTGWEHKGTILPQPAFNDNNSHASIFSFGDKWYMAYHTRKVAKDRGVNSLRQRSVCIDELTYNEDYTIVPIIGSLAGPSQIGSVNPYISNEAETMAAQSYLLPGIEVENFGAVRAVTQIDDGDWIKIAGVDFGEGAASFSARVASGTSGGTIELRLDAVDGPMIGTCVVGSTGGWDKWSTRVCVVNGATGKHDLYLKFTGDTGPLLNLDTWQFKKQMDSLIIEVGQTSLSSFVLSTNSDLYLEAYVDFSDQSENTFQYRVDENSWVHQSISGDGWMVLQTQTNLSSGVHTLSVDGVKMDRFRLSASAGGIGWPMAVDAGKDQTLIDMNADGIESVILSGSVVSATNPVTGAVWKRGSQQTATGTTASVDLPLGRHIITLTAADNGGASGNDTVVIDIEPASSTTNLVAAWERWNTSGSAATIAYGVTAHATETGAWYTSANGAGTDGTFGSLPSPTADVGKNGANGDGFSSEAETEAIDFSISNTSSLYMDLNAFHFDAARRGGPQTFYQLEVLVGSSITAGVVSTGNVSTTYGGNFQDFDIDLTGLADSRIEATGEVQFRLTFMGNAAGKRLELDNVAISSLSDPYPDYDGNQLPDYWEVLYLGSTGQVANVDSDGDGLSNADELVAGTDPGNTTSRFELHSFEKDPVDGFIFKWDSTIERTYQVLKSPGLVSNDWNSVSGDLPGTGGELSYTDSSPVSPSNMFYKIQVTKP